MNTLIPSGYGQLISTYGNPAGPDGKVDPQWEADNLVPFVPPYPFIYINDAGKSLPVRTFQVHRLVTADLRYILTEIYNNARALVKQTDGYAFDSAYYDKRTTEILAGHGCNVYGGAFNYRDKRGQPGVPSVHSFGVAIDFDPAHNAFGAQQGTLPSWFIKPFVDAGWEWGGQWTGTNKDWMHFERCRGY